MQNTFVRSIHGLVPFSLPTTWDILLVTDDIPADQVAHLGLCCATNLEDALVLVAEDHAEPAVNIVSADGVILPVISENSPPCG